MKTLLLILSILFVPAIASADDAYTVYLVRHAEKADDGTRDPDLTEAGQARACWLADWAKGRGIKAVYSTDYKRTQQTAALSAKALGLAVNSYDPRALPAFAELLKSQGESALVVGHSNTTPALTSILSSGEYAYLGEKAYSEIYEVSFGEEGAKVAVITARPPADFTFT